VTGEAAEHGVSTTEQYRRDPEVLARNLAVDLVHVTEAAALAAARFIGTGDKEAADKAAVDAMRLVLATVPMSGVVVIGEGEKDEAPMLYNGEEVGTGDGPRFDIAVDPVECTDLLAAGLPGSLATIAFAGEGCMWSPGPAHYQDKLVVGRAARDAIDLRDEPERNVERVADALEKPVDEMRVLVLDKPRHEELIERIHAAGAAVISPPDGDVGGALQALLPGGGADLLMGVGGTPEGMMTACAVRSLGGFMQAQLAPQSDEEAKAIEEGGLSTERVYELDDLVDGDGFFVATGVTGDNLVRKPWQENGQTFTEAIIVAAGCVRRVVEAQPAATSTAVNENQEAGTAKGDDE